MHRRGPTFNSGNPTVFRSGLVEIEPDEEWRARLGRQDRPVADALALPVLRRCGDALRAGAATRALATAEVGRAP